MRRIFFSLLSFLLGIRKNKTNATKTVIILIDGLGYDTLTFALQKKKCPSISKLLSQDFTLHKYYCGVPASTTSTEALLFYGTNENIPGFTWYDRSLNLFVRGNRSHELSVFEDTFPKKRELMRDGSAIMSVYTGGANQLVLSGRNLRFPKTTTMLKLFQYISLCILYPVQFIRILSLALKTALLYKKNNHQKSRRIFETIFLGQFSCFLTEIEIYRGTPRIFVDFLLYDEFAHKYGPTHASAISALHLIDRYIHRIQKTIDATGSEYQILILSDHGQSPSTPYDNHIDQSVIDIQTAFTPAKVDVVKTYGTPIQNSESEVIYAVPAGSMLQIYFSHSLSKPYYEQDLNKKYPDCIQNLVQQPAFGWLLVRIAPDITKCISKHGYVLFNKGKVHSTSGSPFDSFEGNTVQHILQSLAIYSHYPNNGDIVLFGSSTQNNEVYSFENHKGTHGGFYGQMCYPFCITNSTSIQAELRNPSMTMETLFNKIEYNMR